MPSSSYDTGKPVTSCDGFSAGRPPLCFGIFSSISPALAENRFHLATDFLLDAPAGRCCEGSSHRVPGRGTPNRPSSFASAASASNPWTCRSYRVQAPQRAVYAFHRPDRIPLPAARDLGPWKVVVTASVIDFRPPYPLSAVRPQRGHDHCRGQPGDSHSIIAGNAQAESPHTCARAASILIPPKIEQNSPHQSGGGTSAGQPRGSSVAGASAARVLTASAARWAVELSSKSPSKSRRKSIIFCSPVTA